MKQRIFILLFLCLLVGVLIALNATAYVQKQKTPDSEFSPNRSTYNSGATGTLALYTLLSESKQKVTRWQDTPGGLLAASRNTPAVFVVIGSVRREFTRAECDDLLRWTAKGGRLVIIDREPSKDLVTNLGDWKFTFDNPDRVEILSVDPADQSAMIGGRGAARPVLPTAFTAGINAVQPSRFAADIKYERVAASEKFPQRFPDIPPPEMSAGGAAGPAPVTHVADEGSNLVTEFPYGTGRIIMVSDPFFVTNNGISNVDNIQLALNILSVGDGIIAFDEYHQGYGAKNNRLLSFFEGTPIVAVFLQLAALVGLVFYSQSRRFGRPVPEPEPGRLAKLEYVSAMAELQRRIRGFDLALENVYSEFRRRAVRLSGTGDLTNPRSDLAAYAAERSGYNKSEVEGILLKCEEIIQGEPTNQHEILRLVRYLREFEEKMNMARSKRDAAR